MSRIVTYIFGAGASAQRLPIVADMPMRLVKFWFDIKASIVEPKLRQEVINKLRTLLLNDMGDLIDMLVMIKDSRGNSLEWRASENGLTNHVNWTYIPLHQSVDTYAKKLFIRRDEVSMEKLRRLKIILALFFACEQYRVDLRYDSFFASIIKDKAEKLPESVRILSWNYDHQFELAYAEFSGNDDIAANQAALRINSKRTRPATGKAKFTPRPIGNFSICKLNGSAGFFHKDDHLEENILRNPVLAEVLGQYADAIGGEKLVPSLSFAWEDDCKIGTGSESIVELAKKAVEGTEVLVVIGYSFPIFNKEIDQVILEGLDIQKVYFQSPEASLIRERFKSFNHPLEDKELELRLDTKQFLLPDEIVIEGPRPSGPQFIKGY